MTLYPQVAENLAEILRVIVCGGLGLIGGLGLLFLQWVFSLFLRLFHSFFD